MFFHNISKKIHPIMPLGYNAKQIRFFTQNLSKVIVLPVLDTMVEKAKKANLSLENTAVVYVHHALETSLTLLQSMFKLNLKPENTFVLGKRYSDNQRVINQIMQHGVRYQPGVDQTGLGGHDTSFTTGINALWADVVRHLKKNNRIKNVIILDHGGYAVKYVPAQILDQYKVVGLEKTTAGIIALGGRLPNVPLVDVSRCAAKKYLESPLIAEAIMTKLAPVIDMNREPTECGVIGYGIIGRAIAEKLLALGHRVMIYDHNPAQLQGLKANPRKNIRPTNDLATLVNFSKLIFGCSGSDVTESLDAFTLAPSNKTLISCSSEDREFLTLLDHIQQKHYSEARKWANSLSDVVYINEFGHEITILRAGFPYNFDNSGESVPAKDIQLTRALVLAGVFQAMDFLDKSAVLGRGNIYALDAGLQELVAQEWLKYQPNERYSKETLAIFNDPEKIARNSSGDQIALSFNNDLSIIENTEENSMRKSL